MMTARRWIAAAVLASGTVLASAAQPAPVQRSGVISGRVLAAGSNTPIEGATVQLSNVDRSGGGQPQELTQGTNERGEFMFASLPPGLYELTASKSPYLPAAFGQIRPGSAVPGVAIRLTNGQRVDSAVLAMPLPAAIAGALIDAQGEPASGLVVRALRYDWVAGQRTPRELGRAAADDRGAYRIPDLLPGEYLISVVPKSEGKFPGPAQLFYPGTPVLAAAMPVIIDSGEERTGVDIQVRPVSLASVSGNLVGSDGQSFDNVRLAVIDLSSGSTPAPGLAPFDTYAVTREGAFTFANLAPGFYRLIAGARVPAGDGTVADACAVADVSVGDKDVSDVRLDLRRCGTLSGSVVFDQGKPRPASVGTVVLQPVDPGRHGLFQPLGRTDADGQFTIAGIMPGRYALSFGRLPEGMVVRSIRIDGRDVQDAAIDIGPSDDVRGLQVTLTDRRSVLTGRLLDGSGRPSPAYLIVIFPADERHWLPGSSRIRAGRPSSDGQYQFRDLPAGSYQLAAVTDAEPDEWFAPSFLRRIAGTSVSVTIAEGEPKTLDVRVR